MTLTIGPLRAGPGHRLVVSDTNTIKQTPRSTIRMSPQS
jgi:hypothetical protein